MHEMTATQSYYVKNVITLIDDFVPDRNLIGRPTFAIFRHNFP